MKRVSDGDRSTSLSFLSCGALQSDEIVGILKVLFRYVGSGTRLALTSMDWLNTREAVILVPDPIPLHQVKPCNCRLTRHTATSYRLRGRFSSQSLSQDDLPQFLLLLEPLTSTSMARSSMRRRWSKGSHRRKRTLSSMTTTTMTMLRIPRARGQLLQKHLQLLQKHLSRFRQWLPNRTRRTLLVSALRVRQASTKAMKCFQARCRTEGAPASCR